MTVDTDQATPADDCSQKERLFAENEKGHGLLKLLSTANVVSGNASVPYHLIFQPLPMDKIDYKCIVPGIGKFGPWSEYINSLALDKQMDLHTGEKNDESTKMEQSRSPSASIICSAHRIVDA